MSNKLTEESGGTKLNGGPSSTREAGEAWLPRKFVTWRRGSERPGQLDNSNRVHKLPGRVGHEVSWTNPRELQPPKTCILLRSVRPQSTYQAGRRLIQPSANSTVPWSTSYPVVLYSWQHNQVLKVIADPAQKRCKAQSQETEVQEIQCVAAGRNPKETDKSGKKVVSGLKYGTWKMMVYLGHSLGFPAHIAVTRLRPQLVFGQIRNVRS